MEILPKLEWCCVEIPAGQETYRSVLTCTQIKSEIYSDLEIVNKFCQQILKLSTT